MPANPTKGKFPGPTLNSVTESKLLGIGPELGGSSRVQGHGTSSATPEKGLAKLGWVGHLMIHSTFLLISSKLPSECHGTPAEAP